MRGGQLYHAMRSQPDDQVWLMACLMAGIAGARAAERGRADIEDACIGFIQMMHERAGTPPPPKGKARQ